MIWKDCTIYANVETGADALGNPLYTPQVIAQTKARYTPWTSAEIVADSRGITKNEQRYALQVKLSQKAILAVLDGIERKVLEQEDYSPRYTVIRVERFRE